MESCCLAVSWLFWRGGSLDIMTKYEQCAELQMQAMQTMKYNEITVPESVDAQVFA